MKPFCTHIFARGHIANFDRMVENAFLFICLAVVVFFYVRELELLGKQYERIYVKNNYSSVEKMCLMQTLAIVEGSSPCFKKGV